MSEVLDLSTKNTSNDDIVTISTQCSNLCTFIDRSNYGNLFICSVNFQLVLYHFWCVNRYGVRAPIPQTRGVLVEDTLPSELLLREKIIIRKLICEV